MKEQRRFPRALVKLPVFFNESNKGQSKDISQKGICVLSREKILANQLFDIEILLEKEKHFKAQSKVQWSRALSPNLYKTGIEFQNYEKFYEQNLKDFLIKHLGIIKERRETYRMLIDVVVNYSIQAKAKTKNINNKGICLYTREPLEEGKIQQLTINLNPNERVTAFAKVVWNKKLKANICENGLTFWDINDSDLCILNNFLKQMSA